MAPIRWPTDILGRFLHHLSLTSDVNAQRVWNQLAFCVLKDEDLAETARRAPRPMIFEIHIDNESKSTTIFQIPFFQAKTACIDVDWGDGCEDQVRKVGSGCVKHKYNAAGDYIVRVYPCGKLISLDHLGFKHASSTDYLELFTKHWWKPLRSIISLGSCGVRSLSSLFHKARRIGADLTKMDLRSIDDVSGLFSEATGFNQSIGKWNVSNVTDMSSMFSGAKSFNQPIGEWNVSNVSGMMSMFCYASSFNQPIGEWNVRNVTDMGSIL